MSAQRSGGSGRRSAAGGGTGTAAAGTVAEAGEFGLIERLTAQLGVGPTCLLGPGDDAALVSTSDNRVVVTTDVLVEGRHFRRDWSSAVDVGHRAAAANLADVAAMGAAPTALVMGLCCPPDVPVEWVEEMAAGMADEAAVAGACVVGGDVVSSPTLTIAVTALGDLRGLPPVTRAGAKPGDELAIAGRIGWAAAGYTVLSRGFRSPRALVDAYRRPQVPYQCGRAAARQGATAMIDISDGLVADLGHLVDASGVSIDLHRDAFEVPDQMRDAARALGANPYEWMFGGGEDHALVATFPTGAVPADDWRTIGTVGKGRGVTVDRRPYEEGLAGWDHFRQ